MSVPQGWSSSTSRSAHSGNWAATSRATSSSGTSISSSCILSWRPTSQAGAQRPEAGAGGADRSASRPRAAAPDERAVAPDRKRRRRGGRGSCSARTTSRRARPPRRAGAASPPRGTRSGRRDRPTSPATGGFVRPASLVRDGRAEQHRRRESRDRGDERRCMPRPRSERLRRDREIEVSAVETARRGRAERNSSGCIRSASGSTYGPSIPRTSSTPCSRKTFSQAPDPQPKSTTLEGWRRRRP